MPGTGLDAREHALRAFRRAGGTLRTSEALDAGVHPATLYALRDDGDLIQLARGLYRLADHELLSEPDYVVVAIKIPKAVVCLISALSFHEITTQVPSAVDIALPRKHSRPRLDHPPIRPHWFSKETWSAGVDDHEIDGTRVRVYSPEKTLADCFKMRNQVGIDVCVEALRLYRERMPVRADQVLEYARLCRVERVITPYLEAVL